MILESSGLALLASLSPTALLIAAVYLGSAQPVRTAAFYLTGAIVMSLVTGVVILVVLRSLDLSHTGEHGPRYELRLALGVALLAAGLFAAKRKPRPPDPSNPKQGFVSRMAASPAPHQRVHRRCPRICARGYVPGRSPGHRHRQGRPRTHTAGRRDRCSDQRAPRLGAPGALLVGPRSDHPVFDLVQWLAAHQRAHRARLGAGRCRGDHGGEWDIWRCSRLASPVP